MIRNDILESFTFRLLAQGMKDRHAAAIVATLKDLGGQDVWREMERYCDSELSDQEQWDGRFEQAVAIIRTMVEQLKNLGGDGLASGADEFLASLETPEPAPHEINKRSAERLIQRVANLNPDAGEIGPGMLRSLVGDAKAILAETGRYDHADALQYSMQARFSRPGTCPGHDDSDHYCKYCRPENFREPGEFGDGATVRRAPEHG